jgi:hypothetical protein
MVYIGHLVVVKPEDPVAYMLHFLEKKIGKGAKKLTIDEKLELNNLRPLQEYFENKLVKLNNRQKRLEEEGENDEDEDEDEGEDEEGEGEGESQGDAHGSDDGSRPETNSNNSSDDEYDEDEVVELPTAIKALPKFRKSVSAEAYGQFNKKGYFSARIIEKGDEANQVIKERLLHSFMFRALDDPDLDVVIAAMEEKIFNRNDTVIQQDEDGDELFVVGEGKLH